MAIATRKSKTSSSVVRKERAPADLLLSTPPRLARDRAAAVVPPVSPYAASANTETIEEKDEDNNLSAAEYFSGAKHEVEQNESVVKGFDFKALGIKPSPQIDRRKAMDKDASLLLAIIPNVALCFRFKPNDPGNNSCWAEKIMMDCCKESVGWVTDSNISTWAFAWHINGVKQVNAKQWGIRLFFLYVQSTDITTKALRSLGEYIVRNINAHPKNSTVTIVPPGDEFIWLNDATWYDLIGMETSLTNLKKETTSFSAGYYEQYKDVIHTYFKRGTFTVDLACMLHAPMSCIQPSLLRAAKKCVANPNLAHRTNFHISTDDENELVDLNNEGSGSDDDSEENELE
jgi:hypothetical protein